MNLVTEREISVSVEDAELAGSLWLPTDGVSGSDPRSLLLMLPGSGPSTRHNDVLFPPIREHLLAQGHAVASFDKRGVGGSTGRLVDTKIERQAADAEACLDVLGAILGDVPLGVFGHSQGGWVAYELGASRGDLSYVIANSGPTVGVAAQERFSLFGARPTGRAAIAAAVFDQVVELAREAASFTDVRPLIAADGSREYFEHYLEHPEAERNWPLFATLFGYTPARALDALEVATLALYGSAERVVPVDACTAEVERIANPHISVVVLDGGDHRLQTDDGVFAPGYFEAIDGFLDRVAPPPS